MPDNHHADRSVRSVDLSGGIFRGGSMNIDLLSLDDINFPPHDLDCMCHLGRYRISPRGDWMSSPSSGDLDTLKICSRLSDPGRRGREKDQGDALQKGYRLGSHTAGRVGELIESIHHREGIRHDRPRPNPNLPKSTFWPDIPAVPAAPPS